MEGERIDAMKKLTVTAMAAVLSLGACAAKVYDWPQLPEGTLPDTEVATNIPLRVNAERPARTPDAQFRSAMVQ